MSWAMKPKIDPRVRAKLEEIGVDAVKSKLVWIMNEGRPGGVVTP